MLNNNYNPMKKLIISFAIAILSIGSTYAATVDGAVITNDGGNVNIHGDDTLVTDDVSASEGETVDIENDECKNNPEMCEMGTMDAADEWSTEATTTAMVGENEITVTALPTTGTTETLLLFFALIIAGFILLRKRA